MPKTYKRYDQTDIRPFKSIYKDGYVTVDNYIAELIFQRRSEYNNISLPHRFWNDPKYKNLYIAQIVHINRLLEKVSSAAILKAFKESKAASILNKKLQELAIQFQSEMDKTQRVLEKKEEDIQKPTIPFGQQNRLTEL